MLQGLGMCHQAGWMESITYLGTTGRQHGEVMEGVQAGAVGTYGHHREAAWDGNYGEDSMGNIGEHYRVRGGLGECC